MRGDRTELACAADTIGKIVGKSNTPEFKKWKDDFVCLLDCEMTHVCSRRLLALIVSLEDVVNGD